MCRGINQVRKSSQNSTLAPTVCCNALVSLSLHQNGRLVISDSASLLSITQRDAAENHAYTIVHYTFVSGQAQQILFCLVGGGARGSSFLPLKGHTIARLKQQHNYLLLHSAPTMVEYNLSAAYYATLEVRCARTWQQATSLMPSI